MIPISELQLLLILTTLLISYVIYIIVNFLVKMRKLKNVLERFPMDPKHWLWGHMDKFPGPGEEGVAYFTEMVKKHPRAACFWIGNYIRPYLVVHHPDTVKAILKRADPKAIKTGIYGYMKHWIDEGILVNSGEKWFRNRRLLTNVFHFDALKHFVQADNKACEPFLKKLSKFAQDDNSFEVLQMASQLTFDILLRCAFSFESGIQESRKINDYIEAVEEHTTLWFQRTFRPWQHFSFIYLLSKDGKKFMKNADYIHKFSEKFIRERKLLIENNSDNDHIDFLDILLKARDETGLGLTDIEIREEVDTFLFAGHDTTSSTISWALYSLACYPQYQKLCQDEIDAVLDGRPDDTLNWNDLQNLPNLTMCIKETLRFHGIVPIIERELDRPLVLDGIELPVGAAISINLYNLHHNPLVWDEPDKYYPERFAPDKVKDMDPYAFVPFSAGPRNCIGQAFAMEEIKIVLGRVLRKFTFSLKANHTPKKLMAAVMKSSNGIHLKVVERLFH